MSVIYFGSGFFFFFLKCHFSILLMDFYPYWESPSNSQIYLSFFFFNRLNEASFLAHPDVNVCDVNWKSYVLIGDYSSSAQFYVTFAVFVFLYCIAALLLYVGYTSLYRDSRKLPMIVSKLFLYKNHLYKDIIFGVKYRFSYTGNENSWHESVQHILICLP